MKRPAYRVLLTRGAEADLAALHDYLREYRSPEQADALLDALSGKIESLEHFPDRGSVPKELAALGIHEFRQLAHPPYRLIYRVVARRVFVMVVADGRRDMQTLLATRLLGLPPG